MWRALGSWSGTGDRQTESFDVTSGALRMEWEAVADPGGSGAAVPPPGVLSVTLHSAISGRPLRTVVDRAGPGSDTVRFGSEPRVAYLLVESEGVRWRLTLQEGVAAEGGPAPHPD